MKIMIQDRTMIVEQPRAVWVEQHSFGGRGVVASNLRRAPILGIYRTEARALEVLEEIFECQRNGRCNYYMPQE